MYETGMVIVELHRNASLEDCPKLEKVSWSRSEIWEMLVDGKERHGAVRGGLRELEF